MGRWQTSQQAHVRQIIDLDAASESVTIVFSPPLGRATVDRRYFDSLADFKRLLSLLRLDGQEGIEVSCPSTESDFQAWFIGLMLQHEPA